MKKILVLLILVTASFIFVFGNAYAGQRCDACHTMHNSQNGSPMTFDSSATANPKLLRGTCMGCHEDTTSANTIKTIGSISVPVISNPNNAPADPGTATTLSGNTTYALAGGNFYWVNTAHGADSHGHNVNLITGANTDGNLSAPPGDTGGFTGIAGNQITCAGTAGCHGDRSITTTAGDAGVNMTALAGAHHDDIFGGATDGTTVGKSFRFLNGVTGYEDSDWQQTATAAEHNEYKGSATLGATGTMSAFCGNCHGAFHAAGTVLSGSDWIRHPTDVSVTAEGGAAYDVILTTGYRIETPVGRVTIAAPASTVAVNQDIVMCLSCHRAHATPNDDILRWSYATMQAGGGGASGTGCFYCHTDKD